MITTIIIIITTSSLGIWHRVESDREEDPCSDRSQEVLRRFPECHGCTTHLPGNHVSTGTNNDHSDGDCEVLMFYASANSHYHHHHSLGSERPREHHPAAARDQGGERQRHLPHLRSHGDWYVEEKRRGSSCLWYDILCCAMICYLSLVYGYIPSWSPHQITHHHTHHHKHHHMPVIHPHHHTCDNMYI